MRGKQQRLIISTRESVQQCHLETLRENGLVLRRQQVTLCQLSRHDLLTAVAVTVQLVIRPQIIPHIVPEVEIIDVVDHVRPLKELQERRPGQVV